MNNRNNRTQEVLSFIKGNPGSSSTEMAQSFHVTPVAVYYHLKRLLQANSIAVQGKGRNTRYFVSQINFNIPFDIQPIIEQVHADLQEAFDGVDLLSITNLLSDTLRVILADGKWLDGIDAFYELVKKENHGNPPSKELFEKRLLAFLLDYLEQERKRRKNGFFDGTSSMETIMKSYDWESYVDKLMFHEIAQLGHWGQLKIATQLYYGKQGSDRSLLENAIQPSSEDIWSYILTEHIDTFIIVPPTIPRKVQFREVLRDFLRSGFLEELPCEKVMNDDRILRPQKELKKYDRIINAQVSIRVPQYEHLDSIKHIVIFDDNFTTGSTINAIAEKLRGQGYNGKITAITITGGFEYVPGVTDVEEV